MKIGTTLFHWRFGPMTVISVEGTVLFLELNHPSGLVNTQAEPVPKKIDIKYVGSYLHLDPNGVFQSPRTDERCFHKFYSTDYISEKNKQEIERCTKNIQELQTEIGDYSEKLGDIEKKILILNKNNGKWEKDKNDKIDIIAGLQKELVLNTNDINYIKMTKSPRESKRLLPGLPRLEEKRSEIISKIEINTQKMEELKSSIELITKDRNLLLDNKDDLGKKKALLLKEIETLNKTIAGIDSKMVLN